MEKERVKNQKSYLLWVSNRKHRPDGFSFYKTTGWIDHEFLSFKLHKQKWLKFIVRYIEYNRSKQFQWDELGNNTFRFLLEFLQEDIEGKPFRDILNILERLQIIDSSDIWLSLRELRNDLTHEYPMMIDETINKLNHLFMQLPLLEKILQTVQHQ